MLVFTLFLPTLVACDMNSIIGVPPVEDVDDEKSNNKHKPSKETETENKSEIETETITTQECDHPFANMVMHESKEPTCTEVGWDAYISCTKCGMSNYIEKSALGHNAGAEATCTEPQRCTRCQIELMAAKGHKPGPEATCTDAQVCSVCNKVLQHPKEHIVLNCICTQCNNDLTSTGLDFTSNGDGTCYVSGLGKCSDDYIYIPGISPDGETVTGIGYRAFEWENIVSVDIPDSVVNIDVAAFYYCQSLETISISNNIEFIGSSAFEGCNELKLNEYDNAYYLGNKANPYLVFIKVKDSNITSCNFNNSTKIILNNALKDCSAIEYLTIPDNIINIGYGLLAKCSSIESIDIPFIGQTKVDANIMGYVFDDDSFTAYDGSYQVYQILEYYPNGGKTLDSVNFPACFSKVTVRSGSITVGAFSNIIGLKEVVLYNTIDCIEGYAFYGCSSLETIYYTGTEEEWKSINITAEGNEILQTATIIYNYVPE